jgi:hypothetical protein
MWLHTKAGFHASTLASSRSARNEHFSFNKALFKYFNMLTIPTGSYVIMNAMTHTYLNVLNFQAVPGDVVNSVGNHLGNDIVRLFHVLH